MPSDSIPLAPGVSVDPSRLRFSASRSGGPGGQAVNKLSTRMELRVAVESIAGLSAAGARRLRALAGRRLTQGDEIVIVASTSRSQLDTKRQCLERLRQLVTRAATPPKKRRPTRPSRSAVERRLAAKRKAGERKAERRKERHQE